MGKRTGQIGNRTLIKAEENSVYGIILRALGNCRFEVYCSDNLTRIAHIRGSMIKRVWMKTDDLVLCSLREGDSKHCDIELKYTEAEVKMLREGGYVTDSFMSRDAGMDDQKVDFSRL